jgi:gamma-tubulin complex component 2
VCESAFKVRTFVRQQSQYEYGMVSHAFCAAVRRIVRDFDALVAQMEHLYIQQNLSLQKMVKSAFLQTIIGYFFACEILLQQYL